MLILCLHDVVASDPSSPWAVTEREIDAILTRYRERDYVLATLDDLPHAPERSIAVTVDDGRSGALSWLLHSAPDLGLSATVFIVPGWIDDPAGMPDAERYSEFGTWDEVALLLDAGHSVGSHSQTHVRLPGLAEDALRYELRHSRTRIMRRAGIAARHFAAPYGRIDSLVVEAALDAGYATVGSTVPGLNTDHERRSRVLKRTVLRRDRPNLGLADWEAGR